MVIGVGVDVTERGEEGTCLALLALLLLLAVEVLLLFLLVLVLVLVLVVVPALGLVLVGAVSDEVTRLAAFEVGVVVSSPVLLRLSLKRMNRLVIKASSSTLSTSSCSSETDNKEDKAKDMFDMLAEEGCSDPDMRARLWGSVGFACFDLSFMSTSVDFSLEKSSLVERVSYHDPKSARVSKLDHDQCKANQQCSLSFR